MKATVAGTTATLTFEAPNVDACTVVTGYSVTNDRDGSVVTLGPDATSAVIKDLEEGETYVFTVTVFYASADSADADADPVTVQVTPLVGGISVDRPGPATDPALDPAVPAVPRFTG